MKLLVFVISINFDIETKFFGCIASTVMEKEDLSKVIPPRDFPSDVSKWMKQNANPQMALKLMQVCKYFQHKDGFPYLVVKSVESCGNIWIYFTLDGKRYEYEKIEDISKKFWITQEVDLVISYNVTTKLLRKTAVCNIRKLKLDSQIITFDQFKALTDGGNVEVCELMQTFITYENDEIVSLEEIFECLPKCRRIVLSNFTSIRSMSELNANIPPKLEHFTLWISSTLAFDLIGFSTFMMKHPKIHYTLWFCGYSSAEFIQHYGKAVDEVVDNWPLEFEAPHFCVSNQSDTFHAMVKQFALL